MWSLLLNLCVFRWVGTAFRRACDCVDSLNAGTLTLCLYSMLFIHYYVVHRHEAWFFRRWWNFIQEVLYYDLPRRYNPLLVSSIRARSCHTRWSPLEFIVDSSFFNRRWDPRLVPVLLHVSSAAWDRIRGGRAILPYFVLHEHRRCTCQETCECTLILLISSGLELHEELMAIFYVFVYGIWIGRRTVWSCWFDGARLYTPTSIAMDLLVFGSIWLG